MLTIERTVLPSPEQWDIIMEGMRNPLNSWDKSDSYITDVYDDDTAQVKPSTFHFGEVDHKLASNLARAGAVHAKYRRMIPVFVTLTAPLYWWKEFDTYKVGTVANSCSTMHTIHKKKFEMDDFSTEHLCSPDGLMTAIIGELNAWRSGYLRTKEKLYWQQLIQLLPTSYNQKRTAALNYEVLHNIYHSRAGHKLDEWQTFREWIETLPYADLMTGVKKEV